MGGSALRFRLCSGRSPSLCLGWWFFLPLSTSLLWSCLPFPPFGGGAFSSSSDESQKLPPGTRCARVVSMCMPRSHNRYDLPMHLVATLGDDSKTDTIKARGGTPCARHHGLSTSTVLAFTRVHAPNDRFAEHIFFHMLLKRVSREMRPHFQIDAAVNHLAMDVDGGPQSSESLCQMTLVRCDRLHT